MDVYFVLYIYNFVSEVKFGELMIVFIWLNLVFREFKNIYLRYNGCIYFISLILKEYFGDKVKICVERKESYIFIILKFIGIYS